MALKDILQAITDEADRLIAEADAKHKERMKEIKQEHATEMERSLSRIRQSKDATLRQMRQQAEAKADMLSRHAILARKRQLLDELYDAAADALAALPKDKQEALLKALLAPTKQKGVVYPAKPHEALLKKLVAAPLTLGEAIDAKGGFRFEGQTEDRDCTVDFLVRRILRPDTEIDTATRLFSGA